MDSLEAGSVESTEKRYGRSETGGFHPRFGPVTVLVLDRDRGRLRAWMRRKEYPFDLTLLERASTKPAAIR